MREYVFQTYGHVAKRILDLAAGFTALFDLPPSSNIGLFSINRPEWFIGEYACYAVGHVTVPLYDTLGDEAIEWIVGQTSMECAIVSLQKVKRDFFLSVLTSKIVAAVAEDEGEAADFEDGGLYGRGDS